MKTFGDKKRTTVNLTHEIVAEANRQEINISAVCRQALIKVLGEGREVEL